MIGELLERDETIRATRPWPRQWLAGALLGLLLAVGAPGRGAAAEAGTATAQDEEKAAGEEKVIPEEQISTTHHTLAIGGRELAYTATAGNYLLKEEDGTPKASIFFVAYTLDGVDDPARRPVTFSFNGGPGAAAVWVHLGAFGPKKVRMDPEGFPLPPPGELVPNEHTLLPETDLVFIDPVSTGWSRAVPGQDPKQFHGVEEDIESVGELIRLWTARNGRWASPKFIAGESYGTTRAAGLAGYLQNRYGMYLNGLVLISPVLNWLNQEFEVGNQLPCMTHLPTYAATAWYHGKLPEELSADLEATLQEVEELALGDYALALHQGDALAPERREEIAGRLARYTGLSAEYVERSNLCVHIYRFIKELLRDEGKTVGRLDSRFTGHDRDQVGETPEYDPSLVAVDIGYVGLLNDYLRRELGYETDLVYESLSRRVWPWSFDEQQNRYLNVAETLRQAMTRNRSLQVLVASGYYDLATPYFDAEYTTAHLGLPEELRDHVEIAYYRAGHMMYIKETEHRKLHDDLAAFYRKALGE